MIRIPFRNPGSKLSVKYSYELVHEVFLNNIKPWTPAHYQEKAGSPENNNQIRTIKEDIRNKLLVIQDRYCAFCGLDLDIVREKHREHIAPQSQKNEYIFEPENLVMACYDCNDSKGRTHTIISNTQIYQTESFNILHPYRDDFGSYLIAFYENGGLFFEVLDGITDRRAIKTISVLGLQDPKLIVERGMRIRIALIDCTPADDELIRRTCSIPNRISK